MLEVGAKESYVSHCKILVFSQFDIVNPSVKLFLVSPVRLEIFTKTFPRFRADSSQREDARVNTLTK